MADKHKYRPYLSGLPPWIALGVVAVLLPVVAVMTVTDIHRQKRQGIDTMMEKGAALIRSFEAGTRMGMRGGHGRGFELQRLLVETAAQPDIAHLLVVRTAGTVIAHSDPARVGRPYETDLDLEAVFRTGRLNWRRTEAAAGAAVFEIYGRFAPLARHRLAPPHGQATTPPPGRMHAAAPPPMVIFLGFHTDAMDAALAAGVRNTLTMAVILLLLGSAGVLLLFLAQNYRATRSTLARTKAFSDTLVARIPIGLIALDRHDAVTALNAAAQATLGLAAADVIDRPARDSLPDQLTTVLGDDADTVDQEIRCPLADGRSVPVELFAARLKDENGRRFGQVILFKDLSEIRALHREVEENRRLASVGRLAAGVAHEIRNPLSSIKGFATYFKEKYQACDKDREIAAILIQEVERLDRVVGQLLAFARPLRLHRQATALGPLVRDLFKMIEDRCREGGVTPILEMADPDLCAVVDADKMHQVLLNLLLNALDALPAGGALTLQASALGHDGGGIHLAVIDTGKGIAPDDQAHVFEPYFSTKTNGTGLGLAIVHNIVAAHRGSIEVHSRPGRGTAVRIALPAAQEN